MSKPGPGLQGFWLIHSIRQTWQLAVKIGRFYGRSPTLITRCGPGAFFRWPTKCAIRCYSGKIEGFRRLLGYNNGKWLPITIESGCL